MSESYPFEGKPRKNVQLACFLATTTKMRDAVSATTLYQNKSVSLWPSNTDRLLETTGAQEFPDSCTAPHKLLLLRVFPLQATVSASKRSSCGRCKRGSAPQTGTVRLKKFTPSKPPQISETRVNRVSASRSKIIFTASLDFMTATNSEVNKQRS